MVLTFYGAEILLCKKFFFVRYFLRHSVKHAAAVICISRFTANEVARLTTRPVELIPFGCTVRPHPSRKDPTKPVKDVLFVGRLVTRKGLDYLLRAIPLCDRVPVHLHVVGDGDEATAWQALAREQGLDTKVTFHGVVSNEDLERYYADADVFVLPAIVDERGDTEGLGVVLVEALGFRTPVVASNVGGIPDVIIDGETGLLVPERNPAALAGAIQRLLEDRELAADLAGRGLRYARDYFAWDGIIRRQRAVYEAVLKPQGEKQHAPVLVAH